MVFYPPAWVPQLPEVPTSITVEEFLRNEKYGRHALSTSQPPYTCGLTGSSHTATEFTTRIDHLARALSQRLLINGGEGTEWDRVVCLFSFNTIDYMTVSHAVHRLGGIVTPASAAYSASELAHQLRSSGAKSLFTCTPLLGIALEAAKAAGITEDAIFLLPLPDDGAKTTRLLSVDDLITAGRGLPLVPPLRWTEGQGVRQVAFLCYSSGTSGLPKAVMISHHNVIANILQSALYDGVARTKLGLDTQVTLGLLPLSHIYGLTLVALVGEYHGDEVIILPRFQLDTFLAAVERFKIEKLSIVPPILIHMMSDKEKCDRVDFSSVRSVYSGAAPLGAELVESLQEVYPNIHVTQAYGLTEASPIVTITSELDFFIGSSGSLVPGTKAKVVDAEGNEVTALETRGELLVQSPSIVLGYMNNEKANSETFVWHDDGRWLKTGDEVLVRKSPQGHEHFFVVDRIKELIKVKGHQVAPAELESHILAHSFVSDCAVIPVPHDRAGEVPKAYVVKSKDAPADDKATIAAILEHVRVHKAKYKWLAGGVEFLQVIPKSPSGKILRRTLRDKERQARLAIQAKL